MISALMLAGSLAACEEVNTFVDRESEELRQNIAQKEESFRPLAGEYHGIMTYERSAIQKAVTLVLIPTTIIVQNPGRNDISQVPSLGGTLSVIAESRTVGEESVIPIAHYDMAVWDPSNSALRLNGTIHTASAGGIQVYLEGTVQEDRIVARAHSSLKGFVGTIDVLRVQESGDVSEQTH